MTEADYASDAREGDDRIERRDTGVRILLTILFAVVASLVRGVLSVIVLFSLLWTLVTQQPPSPRVRALANRIIAYYYRILRYLTYNESRVPFPFSDFPDPFEESRWSPTSETLGLSRSPREEAEDWEDADEEHDATDSDADR